MWSFHASKTTSLTYTRIQLKIKMRPLYKPQRNTYHSKSVCNDMSGLHVNPAVWVGSSLSSLRSLRFLSFFLLITTEPTIRLVRQPGLRSACASVQSDQSISCAFYGLQAIQCWINENPCHTGCMYRLSLWWSHRSYYRFCSALTPLSSIFVLYIPFRLFRTNQSMSSKDSH